MRNSVRYGLFIGIFLMQTSLFAQNRDTIKLTITQVVVAPPDTVYVFSSRVDTIALQPLKMDTSQVAIDENPQDLEASKYIVNLMGSVRVNSYYDFQGMPDSEGFLPYDIPVGEKSIDNLSSVYIGARQTRLGLEGIANTRVGSIKAYVEFDFVSSDFSYLRLRHAYAEWNFFKIGHTWTTFMDNASLPATVDFEGPNSALLKRHGVIRFEKKFGERSVFGIALEAPESDYYNPADSLIEEKSKQGNFDLAGRYKYYSSWGHIQAAGIFRRIDYIHVDKMQVLHGWGVLLSSAVNVTKKHMLFLQYSIGDGIANYYVGFGGRMLDALYNPGTDKMQLIPIQGGFVNYSYDLNPKIRFSLTGGVSFVKTFTFQPDDSFKSSQYLAVNMFYSPIETISLGFEFTAGSRRNKNNEKGYAERISMKAQFDF